jgi:pilus assembly protein Flp/PilA
MRRVVKSIVDFLRREDGATFVECALMLALVVVVCIVAISANARPEVSDPVVVQAPPR